MRYQNIYEDIATGERIIPQTKWPSRAQAEAVAEHAILSGMRVVGMVVSMEARHG